MIQTSQTNEAALESHIEKALWADGYQSSTSQDYDREFAVDAAKFWQFLEDTQPDELEKLRGRHDYKRLVLERLSRKIKKDGILAVLKKGLAIDDAHLTLLYRMPYNDLNPDVTKLFESNIFSIARQIYFSDIDKKSVDMVLFINGLPIATFELKNP